MNASEIDRAVWDAHLRPDLRMTEEIEAFALRQWANQLLAEARGWHGQTGRLNERLKIDLHTWEAVVRIHRPEPSDKIGDSSVDLVPYILARVGLMDDGASYHPESPKACRGYFKRGRDVGCHQAEWS